MNRELDLFVILIFTLVQWRVCIVILRAAGGTRRARIGVWLFSLLVAIGYAFTFTEVLSLLKIPAHAAMIMGAVMLAYLLAATGIVAIHFVLDLVRRRFAPEFHPGRRRVLNVAGNVLMAAPFVVIGYGALIERTNFRVREIDVPLGGLPPDLEGLRILQLSDIHLSAFLSEAELARVIDACLELKPHLAVMTGDLISSTGDPLDACIRQLARLKADAGVFGCLGNHERYARAERYTTEASARLGIRFLRSQAAPLRFGNAVLNLAGVDYQSLFAKSDYLQGAESLVTPGACNVLLSHNPDVFPVAVRQGYNLVLAGHTHGGQVTVEILDRTINPARFFTPFVYGLYRSGAAAEYVTRGIGTIAIPARIGAPPEISLLHLRKA